MIRVLETTTYIDNQESIAILKDLLADAEAGLITGIAIAYTRPDRTTGTVSSNSDNYQAILGALCILKHRMLHEEHNETPLPPVS